MTVCLACSGDATQSEVLACSGDATQSEVFPINPLENTSKNKLAWSERVTFLTGQKSHPLEQ